MPAASRPHALSPPPHPVPTCFAGATTPAIDLVAMSEMFRHVTMCTAPPCGSERREDLAACLRQRVWAFGSLAFCASPRSWYPFSALVSLPLRRHCACPLAFSLTQRPAISRSSVRYCHSGLFPPRRHRSFLPLSPPHSNVPTVYLLHRSARQHTHPPFPPARPIALDVRTNRER